MDLLTLLFNYEVVVGYIISIGNMSAMRIGWVGLGQMGQSHVANLLSKGFKDVIVWNRTVSVSEGAKAQGAQVASSAKEVVERADVTFIMLSTPAAAKAVYTAEDGVLAGLSPGKHIVDCASLDAEAMQQLADWVESKDCSFLAAPVAGHSGMAANATVQFICAGNEDLFKKVSPAFDAMGKNSVFLGDDVKKAANMKLVINGMLANVTASIAEGLSLSEKCGIESETMVDILSKHGMNSKVLQFSMKTMFSGIHNPLFMLQHMLKDTRLSHDLAAAVGQTSLITAATQTYYDKAIDMGLGKENWTAVKKAVAGKTDV